MSRLLHLSDQCNYHLYRKETDMRKGFNLLCGIVTGELGRRVTDGDVVYFHQPVANAFEAAGLRAGRFQYFLPPAGERSFRSAGF